MRCRRCDYEMREDEIWRIVNAEGRMYHSAGFMRLVPIFAARFVGHTLCGHALLHAMPAAQLH